MEENWYAVEHDVREQLRKAWIGMWRDPFLMDPYIQEALRREHIADALRQAARRRQVRGAAVEWRGRRCWAAIQRLAQAAANLRARRRVEGGSAKERRVLAHE